jgi:hypothetical protein
MSGIETADMRRPPHTLDQDRPTTDFEPVEELHLTPSETERSGVSESQLTSIASSLVG